MASEKSDDDDQVVGEVDLYFSRPDQHSGLHVLQYPLRNSIVGIGSDRKISAMNMRPKHGRLEVLLSVLPEKPSADHFSGTAQCGESFDETQKFVDQKAIGEVQCLRSSPHLSAPGANYAVGMYVPAEESAQGNAFFTISPVRSVSQLRPAFDYLNQYDMRVMIQRAQEKVLRANARGEVARAQQEEEVAPLRINFRRRESERAAERRKNSHATLRQREEDEPWLPVLFRDVDAKEAKNKRTALFAPDHVTAMFVKKEATVGRNGSDQLMYTDRFRLHTRPVSMGMVAKASTSSEPTSARVLKRLQTNSAVSHVMSQARIASFDDIRRLVGFDKPRNEVLGQTRVVAACLRGCWVAKKGVREGLRKEKNSSERFDASRMLILDLFRRQRIVTFMSALQVLGEPALISFESIEAILKEVAVHKSGIGWEFGLDDDEEFLFRNQELCRVQESDWDKRIATARETLDKSLRIGKKR